MSTEERVQFCCIGGGVVVVVAILVAIVAFPANVEGYRSGQEEREEHWHKELIRRGFGEYDEEHEFQWKSD